MIVGKIAGIIISLGMWVFEKWRSIEYQVWRGISYDVCFVSPEFDNFSTFQYLIRCIAEWPW